MAATTGAATRIVAVGRIGHGPEADLFARYSARLRPAPTVIEVAEARGTVAEMTAREATGLLAASPPGSVVVALDSGGQTPDTATLVRLLAEWRESGPVCFAIGGAEGLHASVLARARYVLSFGRLTWPHLLARALLAEQLYRAQCIATGHPYHRAGRP